jgi:hypothetical protein
VSVQSIKFPGRAGELDLRVKGHVAEMEKLLGAIDPAAVAFQKKGAKGK